MCGPACQKYFHVSDEGDKGSSVRENGWLRLRLRITRGSVFFLLCSRSPQSHCITNKSTSDAAANEIFDRAESYINIAGPSV